MKIERNFRSEEIVFNDTPELLTQRTETTYYSQFKKPHSSCLIRPSGTFFYREGKWNRGIS